VALRPAVRPHPLLSPFPRPLFSPHLGLLEDLEDVVGLVEAHGGHGLGGGHLEGLQALVVPYLPDFGASVGVVEGDLQRA
jgi:hypothetical protein